MGLVNVYPDSAQGANNTPRKFLCQNNLVYWDPVLADMDSILNANMVNSVTNWQSQMIVMNARTDSMFNHIGRYITEPYSYLVTDTWMNKKPAFTDPQNLFTTQLENLKTFAIGTVDLNSLDVLPDWRLVNNDSSNYAYPDWPIPVDLSYSNSNLLTAGIGGFPIGDLNWFPTKKSEWLAQISAEYNNIGNALNEGNLITAAEEPLSLPVDFRLQQNYPNPFNQSTIIHYQIPEIDDISSIKVNVTLKIYDVLGKEIKKLIDEQKSPGKYELIFDGKGLTSGIYFYRLISGDYSITKKMILLK
jgi:hypothetical protein